MKKGFLKIAMLHIISRGEITGYGLIKRIDEIAGVRPSPGAVYPLLRSMEKEGWVVSERRGGKVYYRLTPAGAEKLEEIKELKEEYMKKLHQTLSMAKEVFLHREEESLSAVGLILPILCNVEELIKDGVDRREIQKILKACQEHLRELKREGLRDGRNNKG